MGRDVPAAPFRHGAQQHFWFIIGIEQDDYGCGGEGQGDIAGKGRSFIARMQLCLSYLYREDTNHTDKEFG